MKLRIAILLCGLTLASYGQEPEVLFDQGLKAYAHEDYPHAMSLFEQAVKAAPSVARYIHWYARAAGRRAQQVVFFRAISLANKVRENFERAAQLDPANPEILGDLLEYYLEAPSVVGGGEDKARLIAERLQGVSAAEGHHAQARILSKKKDLAGAERELRAALALEPERQGRILDLAGLLARQRRYGESDPLFDRAAQLAPNAPRYLFARGEMLARDKRDPEQARQLLERYLRSDRNPDDPPPSEVRALLKLL
jgi:tetratricopeptide (TPR) repeat protein